MLRGPSQESYNPQFTGVMDINPNVDRDEEPECDDEEPKCDEEPDEEEEKEDVKEAEEEEETFLDKKEKQKSEQEQLDWKPTEHPLLCRSIRIGSYNVKPTPSCPYVSVILQLDSISFKAPVLNESDKQVNISLQNEDIRQLVVHFGRFPIMFIFTTLSFGEAVRNALHMVPNASPDFDPLYNDDFFTFLIESISEDQKNIIRQVFNGENKVQEIDQETANRIFVKSTQDQESHDPQFPGVMDIKPNVDVEEEPGYDDEEPRYDDEEPECDDEEPECDDEEPDEEEKTLSDENEEEESEQEQVDRKPPEFPLQCRSIRIGPYLILPPSTCPYVPVILQLDRISFKARVLNESNKHIIISLRNEDIRNLFFHFGGGMPVIFVFTTPRFGESVRNALHMVPTPYFDHSYNDDFFTFLIESMTEDQENYIRHIFPEENKVNEIDQETANRIFVKSIRDQESHDPEFPGVMDINLNGDVEEEPECDDEKPKCDDEETECDDEDPDEEEETLSDENEESEQEQLDGKPTEHPLQCRSIRIGSYKVFPPPCCSYVPVILQLDSISFNAPVLNESNKHIMISLRNEDILQLVFHFGERLPIMFVFTTPRFGEAVRNALHMIPKATPYFDHSYYDDNTNKLTFLIENISEDQKNFIQQVFPGENKVKEIDQRRANEILVKSTPLKSDKPLFRVLMDINPNVDREEESESDDEESEEEEEPLSEENEEEESEQEQLAWNPTEHPLQCRNIRIGSYNILPQHSCPYVPVILQFDSISFKASMMNESNKQVNISLQNEDIRQLVVHFGTVSVMFVFPTLSFGEAVRNSLNMVPNETPDFDPSYNYDFFTFVIDSMSENQKNFIRKVFPGENKVQEIDEETKNKFYFKCTLGLGCYDPQFPGFMDINPNVDKEEEPGYDDEEPDEEEENLSDEKKKDKSEQEQLDWNPNEHPLQCRSIMVGGHYILSPTSCPLVKAFLHLDSISFRAPVMNQPNRRVNVSLRKKDIRRLFIYFGRYPIMFVLTIPRFGEDTRKALNLAPNATPNFDRACNYNLFTFLIDNMSEDQKKHIRHVFSGENKLKEMDQETANRIFLKSTQICVTKVNISTQPVAKMSTDREQIDVEKDVNHKVEERLEGEEYENSGSSDFTFNPNKSKKAKNIKESSNFDGTEGYPDSDIKMEYNVNQNVEEADNNANEENTKKLKKYHSAIQEKVSVENSDEFTVSCLEVANNSDAHTKKRSRSQNSEALLESFENVTEKSFESTTTNELETTENKKHKKKKHSESTELFSNESNDVTQNTSEFKADDDSENSMKKKRHHSENQDEDNEDVSKDTSDVKDNSIKKHKKKRHETLEVEKQSVIEKTLKNHRL